MRTLGLSGITRAQRIRTTIPGKDGNRAGDLLNWDSTAPRPDHTWVMDFTYVRSWAGWVYVGVHLLRVLAAHRGLACADHQAHRSGHDPAAYRAVGTGPAGHPVEPNQLRPHSDAGSQYTSLVWTEKLALDGIAPSIGSIGDAYDNALMETINGLYKAECVRTTIFHDGAYKTIADVEYATAGWVDWYNHRRLHGSLGMVSPNESSCPLRGSHTRAAPRIEAAENLGRFKQTVDHWLWLAVRVGRNFRSGASSLRCVSTCSPLRVRRWKSQVFDHPRTQALAGC